jgi:hypothetical protein
VVAGVAMIEEHRQRIAKLEERVKKFEDAPAV